MFHASSCANPARNPSTGGRTEYHRSTVPCVHGIPFWVPLIWNRYKEKNERERRVCVQQGVVGKRMLDVDMTIKGRSDRDFHFYSSQAFPTFPLPSLSLFFNLPSDSSIFRIYATLTNQLFADSQHMPHTLCVQTKHVIVVCLDDSFQ